MEISKHNLASRAEFDGDFWILFLDFPLFSDCEVGFDYDFGLEQRIPSLTTVQVLIEGDTVTQEQERDWELLLSDLPRVRLLTLEALAKAGRSLADRMPNLSSERKNLYFSPQEIVGMIAFSGINIHQRQPDGHAWISLDFAVGWDGEHGASVLWSPRGVEAVGGAAEFTNRGDTVAAHAVYYG